MGQSVSRFGKSRLGKVRFAQGWRTATHAAGTTTTGEAPQPRTATSPRPGASTGAAPTPRSN